ncbi:MAG: ribbon-helix-helix domain-containing protein [Cyanobium sp.]
MVSTPANPPRLELLQRSPQRLSVTLSHHLHQVLQERSDYEGRSMSNLAAFLLEQGPCPLEGLVIRSSMP